MVRISNPYLAKEIYYRLEGGEDDFGDLATKYSEGVENRTRGIVGPVPLGQAHPKLIEQLKTIEPGKVQSPINIGNSYIVIRLESYEPATLDKFMRFKMEDELFDQSIEDQVEDLILSLLNNEDNAPINGDL